MLQAQNTDFPPNIVNSNAVHVAEPDPMCFKFGYSSTVTGYGEHADQVNLQNSTQRGLVFKRPRFRDDNVVECITEVMHLGRDRQTFGCRLDYAFARSANEIAQVTIAPWDWQHAYNNDET